MAGMRSLLALIASAVVVAACGSKTGESPAPDGAASGEPAGSESSPASAMTGAPGVPAHAVTQASWSPDALEELLAPIALYPDALLGQILAASVNSQEVLDAGNWLLQNQDLKGDALDAAAVKAGFGPAMRALIQFPTVVDMLCQQIDWTRQLGSAFTSNQKAVLDAVQRLRVQAAKVGNLESTPQQKVETKKEEGKEIVEVKPANPKVVYVPQYNPQVVYTTPPPPAPPPAQTTTSTENTVSTGAAVAGGLVAFGVGVLLGSAFHEDDYYYPHWGAGAVYLGPRPFYPPAYVYRPVYGPAFRPAYRYAPPPGYRYAYNNVTVNNRNVVIDNNEYFNRFANNQNLRVDPVRNTVAQQNVYRGGQVREPAGTQRTESWKGRSTYEGARNPATEARLSEAAGERVAPRDTLANNSAARARDVDGRARDAGRVQHVDRGYGGSTRDVHGDHVAPQARQISGRADTIRDPAAPRQSERDFSERDSPARQDRERDPAEIRENTRERGTDRDVTRDDLPDVRNVSGNRESALAGAGRRGGGSFDRAASARGHASFGGREARGGHRR